MEKKYTVTMFLKAISLVAAVSMGAAALGSGSVSEHRLFLGLALALFGLFMLMSIIETWWSHTALTEVPAEPALQTPSLQEKPEDFKKEEFLSERIGAVVEKALQTVIKDQEKMQTQMQEKLENSRSDFKKEEFLSERIGAIVEKALQTVIKDQEKMQAQMQEKLMSRGSDFKKEEFLSERIGVIVEKAVQSIRHDQERMQEKLQEKVINLGSEWMTEFRSAVKDFSRVVETGNLSAGTVLEKVEPMMTGMKNALEAMQAGAEDVRNAGAENVSAGRELIEGLLEKFESALSGYRDNQSPKEDKLTPAADQLTAAVEKLASFSAKADEIGTLMQVNQAGFQAGVEMLNTGLERIMEKLEAVAGAPQDQEEYMKKLLQTLEIFHEKAGEILIENACRTREILAGGDLVEKK